jgi:predicted NBD/HSP70 family sugar kinase
VNSLHTTPAPGRRADQHAVRVFNLSTVARLLALEPASRAQLAKSTGLNKTTISSLAAELIDRGVVTETGLDADGSVGRPARMLELSDRHIATLGLEINVDYLAACVCDLRGGVRHHVVVGHDNRARPPERVIDELAELARDALARCVELGLRPVGACVCLPGLVDAENGTLVWAPNLGWRSFPVVVRMRQALDDPSFPIRVENDGNLAALGELENGALRGTRFGLLVHGGIGVGGALIVDGALYRGAGGFAGELGHLSMRPFDGDLCQCGARGCLETLVGQEAIARMVGIEGARNEQATPAVVLANRAADGDARALEVLDEVARMLGVGIATAVNAFNPDRIVLAGTFAVLGPWLMRGIAAELEERAATASRNLEVSISELGDEAGVRGGAALVLHELLADPTRAPTLSHA